MTTSQRGITIGGARGTVNGRHPASTQITRRLHVDAETRKGTSMTTPTGIEVPIAALFVAQNGPYFGKPGIDPYDITRDARTYTGPHPVVAHPPCARWSRLNACTGRNRGDDSGCFAFALHAVRQYGGVLEHPAYSSAWDWWGIIKPPSSGGWVRADMHGWTCQVDQGQYGHRAKKPTWLYAVRCDLPSLKWSPSDGVILHRCSNKQRYVSPAPFHELLVAMARSVRT